jgi:hypothetical protein
MGMFGISAPITVGLAAGSLAGIVIQDGETWESVFLFALSLTLVAGIVSGSGVGAILGLIAALASARRVSWLRADPVLAVAHGRTM